MGKKTKASVASFTLNLNAIHIQHHNIIITSVILPWMNTESNNRTNLRTERDPIKRRKKKSTCVHSGRIGGRQETAYECVQFYGRSLVLCSKAKRHLTLPLAPEKRHGTHHRIEGRKGTFMALTHGAGAGRARTHVRTRARTHAWP